MSDAEAQALAELDRRAGRATTALLARIDDLVDDDDAPPAAAPDPAGPPAPADRAATSGDGLARPGRPRDPGDALAGARQRRRRRGPLLLAAAAAIVLMAGIAAALAVGRDQPADVASGGPPPYLVPGWLPAGLELDRATLGETDTGTGDTGAGSTGTGGTGLAGRVATYGDRRAADPWADTLTAVELPGADTSGAAGSDGEISIDLTSSEGEAITIGGQPADLSRPPASATEVPMSWRVQWVDDDGTARVVSATGDITRDEAVAAAEAAAGGGIDPSGLPAGFEELASGALDGAVAASIPAGSLDVGLSLSYADFTTPEADAPTLAIFERPGDAAAVDLLRTAYRDAEATEVRGHAAVRGRAGEMTAVQWLEADGQLMTVVAVGLDDDALTRVLDGLRPAEAGEVEALTAGPTAELGALPAGAVEVASGDSASGYRWRVTATQDAEPGLGALTVETAGEDGAGSSSSSGSGSGEDAGPIDFATDSSDGGEPVLYGVAAPAVSTVAVEGPGRPAVAVELVEVEGWSRRAFALAVAPADLAGADLVARDAGGQELYRSPLAFDLGATEATVPG